MKMPKHMRKYVEGELTAYPVNKKALIQAHQNLYLRHSATGYTELTKHSDTSTSMVEHSVMSLMSDRNILRLENTVTSVEDVLNELPEEYRKLIELTYFKTCNNQYVADELNICLRSFYHWRDKALLLFAMRLGLV
jgi:RinA family phage transcriptional activator